MITTKQRIFRCLYKAFLHLRWHGDFFLVILIGVAIGFFIFGHFVYEIFTTPYFNNFSDLCSAFLKK